MWMASLSVPEAHTHRLAPGLPLTPSYPCEEGFVRSQQHHHVPDSQPASITAPPIMSPQTEWAPFLLHLVSHQPPPPHDSIDDEDGNLLIEGITYVTGMSEEVRCNCRGFILRVVFWSVYTLCFMLTRVKDTLPEHKQFRVQDLVQLQQGLHQGNHQETQDQTEGAPESV